MIHSTRRVTYPVLSAGRAVSPRHVLSPAADFHAVGVDVGAPEPRAKDTLQVQAPRVRHATTKLTSERSYLSTSALLFIIVIIDQLVGAWREKGGWGV